MIWKWLSRAASPGGKRGRLSVLFFHRVVAKPDPLAPWEPTAEGFDNILRWLGSQVEVLPLAEAVTRLREGRLPRAAAAVTFDDGYLDNAEIAAPILQRHGIPATFFVASSFLDGGIMWNDVVIESIRGSRLDTLHVSSLNLPPLALRTWDDKRQAIDSLLKTTKYLAFDERAQAVASIQQACGVEPSRGLMMSSQQVRDLASAGFTVGAHTDTHPILLRLPDEEARREIHVGKARLEALVQQPVTLFAYPNGRWQVDFDERHAKMVAQAGFAAAFSTEAGVSTSSADPYALPRFTPWDRTQFKFRARLIHNMQRG